MNYMNEVAKMLGVELGEEFELDDYTCTKMKITEECVEIYVLGKWEYSTASCIVLHQVLNGRCAIKRT